MNEPHAILGKNSANCNALTRIARVLSACPCALPLNAAACASSPAERAPAAADVRVAPTSRSTRRSSSRGGGRPPCAGDRPGDRAPAPPASGVRAPCRDERAAHGDVGALPSARQRVEAEARFAALPQLPGAGVGNRDALRPRARRPRPRSRGNVAGSCENADLRSRGMPGSRGHDGRRALAREPHAHLLPLQGAPRLIAPRRDAGSSAPTSTATESVIDAHDASPSPSGRDDDRAREHHAVDDRIVIVGVGAAHLADAAASRSPARGAGGACRPPSA